MPDASALEHAEALGVGPVQILEDDHRTASRDAVHVRLTTAPSRSGLSGTRSMPKASSASSNGRPSDPGSAWPASVVTPAGRVAQNSREQPRLADACLADHQCDRGV